MSSSSSTWERKARFCTFLRSSSFFLLLVGRFGCELSHNRKLIPSRPGVSSFTTTRTINSPLYRPAANFKQIKSPPANTPPKNRRNVFINFSVTYMQQFNCRYFFRPLLRIPVIIGIDRARLELLLISRQTI